MELRKIIRTDVAASAIAHLTLVGLIILISEVHPFHAAPPETVSVDIVTPDQVEEQNKEQETKAEEAAKEKPPEPPPDFKLPKLDFTDKDTSQQPQASPGPQQPQPQPSQPPKRREANAQPQLQPAPQPPAAMPPAAPSAYQPPEPDVTIKYGVMLGLPPELPPERKDAPKDDGGDANDSIGAKLPAEVIAELRRHLQSCAKLPAGVAPHDNMRIRLRVVLATDGTLARPPILIEAPPSAKGATLVKAAMSVLQDCQPYKMLPPDKYQEWKVMDLPFTPQDFGGG